MGTKPAIPKVRARNTRRETQPSYSGKPKEPGELSFFDRNWGRNKRKSPSATHEPFRLRGLERAAIWRFGRTLGSSGSGRDPSQPEAEPDFRMQVEADPACQQAELEK
jgi:hypothetical protein